MNRLTGSGGHLHLGMVAGIKSERRPGSNRNPRPACVGIRKIVEIVLGSVVSEVEVETPWGKVASVITTRAVRELGLEIGSEVIAFVKVTDMAIAKVRDDSDLT